MKISNLNRNLAIAVGALLLGTLAYYFRSIVAYVLIAWVISMVGQPLMRLYLDKFHLDKWKAGKGVSAILVLASFFLIALILIWLFVPMIVDQAAHLATVDLNSIATALEPPIHQLNAWLTKYGLSEEIKPLSQQFREMMLGRFDPTEIATVFSSLISITAGFFVDLFSILFIAFFFLKEHGLFVSFLSAIVPQRYEAQIRHAVDESSRMLTRYFGGILLQMSIITVLVTVGLTILGIKNALLIGLFAALINVIPYVGPIIAAAFGVFVAISSNLELDFYTQLLPLCAKVVAVFVSVQLIDNFILQTFIFSNSVQAHPLEIFIVILMGAQINGITGMILAIPTYTVLRVVARVFLSEFKIVQKLTRNMPKEE